MDEKKERRLFPGTKRVREVVYLHPEEAEALQEAADREGSSKSELIRRAVREFLGSLAK